MDYSELRLILPQKVFTNLPDCATKYRINTPLRLAHFLAQCAHESEGFTRVVENMNYSAERLLEIFGDYFTEEQAQFYARKPVLIGSHVYANRMGNGDEESCDGFEFRGGGYMQLTGKENYALFNETVPDDVLKDPRLVSSKYALESATWFWQHNGLNVIADAGPTELVVKKITKRVNGGYNGLKDRINYFDRFYSLIRL